MKKEKNLISWCCFYNPMYTGCPLICLSKEGKEKKIIKTNTETKYI